MSKDFPTAAGSLWARLATEIGVEASITTCGYFISIVKAQCVIKRDKLTDKIQAAGAENATTDQVFQLERLSKDLKRLEKLDDDWAEVRKSMKPQPGSTYYLTTTTQIQKISSGVLEIAIRNDLIDIPDAAKFAAYRPEGETW